MSRLRWLRLVPLLLPSLAALGACDRPEWRTSDSVPVATAGSSSTPVGFGGSAGDTCALDLSKGPLPIFSEQALLSTSPARRELYAYVSDADAKALRESGTLFPPLSAGMPVPTPAVIAQLNKLAVRTPSAPKPLLDGLLQGFKRVRSAWPNPWALRLIDHPGTEHLNPVRIVLRDSAWIARINDGALVVVDAKNQIVSGDVAALDPGRVAAIFTAVVPSTSGNISPSCEQGFREFSVANERMIESWSLATPEILERLDADVKLLSELFGVVRSCPGVDRGGVTFRSYTVCTTWSVFSTATEYAAYGWALATPSELYKPSGQNLVNLVDALKSDRFEPDPFIVKPSATPAGGSGGTAGSAGAGGSGGAGGSSGGGQGGSSEAGFGPDAAGMGGVP